MDSTAAQTETKDVGRCYDAAQLLEELKLAYESLPQSDRCAVKSALHEALNG